MRKTRPSKRPQQVLAVSQSMAYAASPCRNFGAPLRLRPNSPAVYLKSLTNGCNRTVLAGEARAPCLSLPYPTRESRSPVAARSSRSFVAGHPTPTRCAPSLPCAASERSPKQRAAVRLLAPPRRARPAPSYRFALVRSSRTFDCREAFAVAPHASRFAPARHRCAGRMAPRAAHRGLVAGSPGGGGI